MTEKYLKKTLIFLYLWAYNIKELMSTIITMPIFGENFVNKVLIHGETDHLKRRKEGKRDGI